MCVSVWWYLVFSFYPILAVDWWFDQESETPQIQRGTQKMNYPIGKSSSRLNFGGFML